MHSSGGLYNRISFGLKHFVFIIGTPFWVHYLDVVVLCLISAGMGLYLYELFDYDLVGMRLWGLFEVNSLLIVCKNYFEWVNR